MKSPFIVGISGGTGAGKTFIVQSLGKFFSPKDICFISLDNYYKQIEFVPKDANGIENFDTLEAIDFNRLLGDVKKLKRGETFESLEYTFNQPGKIPQKILLKPAPIIFIEGIYLFAVPEIFDLFDLKIFIEASETVKIKRRILRDANERGYDLEDVFYRFEHHVVPAYEKYIRPLIEKADLVIPNYHNLDKAVEVLRAYLKQKINDSAEG